MRARRSGRAAVARAWRTLLAALVVTVGLAVGGASAAHADGGPRDLLLPDEGAHFGVFVEARDGWTKAQRTREVLRQERHLGRAYDIVHWFYPFGRSFPSWREDFAHDRGSIPMMTLGPAPSGEVARGEHDAYYRAGAEAVAAADWDVFLRFHHEMDGAWTATASESPEAFIASWRRVHGIFRDAGADNAVFVWCPTSWGFDKGHALQWYPGDDVVDWVCADGYNWAPVRPEATWKQVDEIFAAFYAFGQERGKPMMVGEWGVAERDPGEKATWLREAGRLFAERLPDIRAVVYFDSYAEHNWWVDTSPSSWEAWADLANQPWFTARAEQVRPAPPEDGSSPDASAGAATAARPAAKRAVTERLAGPTRVETAVAQSAAAFAAARTVVLARADLYADALAGAPLAAGLGAPLLLTASDALVDVVADELDRLGATDVVLLGGPAALSPAVAEALAARGLSVRRVAGDDRHATAAAIADALDATPRAGTDAFLVGGRAWGDAVAVSGLAAATDTPILLTAADGLPEATRRRLATSGATHVTIVGTSDRVGGAVVDALATMGITVARVGGSDPAATSAALVGVARDAAVDTARVWVATARTWPDALAAGATIGHAGGVLVLVHDSARSLPAGLEGEATRVTVLGGPAAVSQQVLEALAA